MKYGGIRKIRENKKEAVKRNKKEKEMCACKFHNVLIYFSRLTYRNLFYFSLPNA